MLPFMHRVTAGLRGFFKALKIIRRCIYLITTVMEASGVRTGKVSVGLDELSWFVLYTQQTGCHLLER